MHHIKMLRQDGDFQLRMAVGLDPEKREPRNFVRFTLPDCSEVEMTRNEARTLALALDRLLDVPLKHVELASQVSEA